MSESHENVYESIKEVVGNKRCFIIEWADESDWHFVGKFLVLESYTWTLKLIDMLKKQIYKMSQSIDEDVCEQLENTTQH